MYYAQVGCSVRPNTNHPHTSSKWVWACWWCTPPNCRGSGQCNGKIFPRKRCYMCASRTIASVGCRYVSRQLSCLLNSSLCTCNINSSNVVCFLKMLDKKTTLTPVVRGIMYTHLDTLLNLTEFRFSLAPSNAFDTVWSFFMPSKNWKWIYNWFVHNMRL